MKKKTKTKKKKISKKLLLILAVLIILMVIAYLIYRNQLEQDKYKVSGTVSEKSYTVEYNGKEYEYNNGITSILIVGIDSEGEMEVSSKYGGQARADTVVLISLDTRNKCIRMLPISRDTMTEVCKYTAGGFEAGYIKTHIGFAYSYGNGGSASSMNVCDAVSRLMYGIPVYKYVTTNRSSIVYANNMIGGVEVTVPNDDLYGKYPEMEKGSVIEIDDSNVEDFLRYRDTAEEGSNNGRMERQRAYMEAVVNKLKNMTEDDYIELWEKLDSNDCPIRTNVTESAFYELIKEIRDYSYNPESDNLEIEGTDGVEDGYDVFYPDTDKLKQLVVSNYFRQI